MTSNAVKECANGGSSLIWVIALFGVYIAFQQWRTAERKRKFDLFERRMEHYQKLKTWIENIIMQAEIDAENFALAENERKKVNVLCMESQFLFGFDIYQAINPLYNTTTVSPDDIVIMGYMPPDERQEEYSVIDGNILKEIYNINDKLDLYHKYLKVEPSFKEEFPLIHKIYNGLIGLKNKTVMFFKK